MRPGYGPGTAPDGARADGPPTARPRLGLVQPVEEQAVGAPVEEQGVGARDLAEEDGGGCYRSRQGVDGGRPRTRACRLALGFADSTDPPARGRPCARYTGGYLMCWDP
ncbi:hypothetical protein GCM10010251_21510 [Streptomyces aurantiogriseus]|uniref:Uncharacterized protein n=1 Tax=Streptomyces aurantiogriseus TaxID=66870 RepID=A0A918F568_9ACTN|nr:hypothetical protein GCM10010251_21510 [Streptomyces aurantiogriseus]